jgi:hypothetical protein
MMNLNCPWRDRPVYSNQFPSHALGKDVNCYFMYYNGDRPHSAFEYHYPNRTYRRGLETAASHARVTNQKRCLIYSHQGIRRSQESAQ